MIDRRHFLATAAAMGASAAWAGALPRGAAPKWIERRDLYPQGVASGDPDEHSVILWTRRPFDDGTRAATLDVTVAEDANFSRIVATARVPVAAASDWTGRALVGGLKSRHAYWYRFTDDSGAGSRIGRTTTAPAPHDERTSPFAYVSCQNANQGAQNAFRRMIHEDTAAPDAEQLGFVLHLGDFIYEIVWYPEDRPQGMYDRRLRDVVRYASGEKIGDFHVPTTLADYRTAYKGYLADPDLQDARARWPFVAMWDNHEFSWRGWQSVQEFGKGSVPRQSRKVAANQAWFEYQAARIAKPDGGVVTAFKGPSVEDTPVTAFDRDGLGLEPDNLAAIDSLKGYRTFRWGANFELIITDQRSYCSRDPSEKPEADALNDPAFLNFIAEEDWKAIDAGRAFADGTPPATIGTGAQKVPNVWRTDPPQTILGARQKAWFLDRLRHSSAPWKIWGNTIATLDWRADPQNLPAGLTKPWPGAGYGVVGGGDYGSAFHERAEIYDTVARERITGFATLSGDRHSFWAGVASSELPPGRFDPVGVAFVVGSISAPGPIEAMEHRLAKTHPLRPLMLADRAGHAKPEATANILLRHGVLSALEYSRSGDHAAAVAKRNPDLAPHLSFVDLAGHGYGVVRASAARLDVTFVCIARPLERAGADGGPVRYIVTHGAPLWAAGETPVVSRIAATGDLGTSA